MRTVRTFPIIAFAVPLALCACGGDSDREAKSPTPVAFESPPPSEPSTMTPASRVDESQGTRDTTTPIPRDDGAAPEATQSAPLNDAQIVALTDAANTAEVDAAKIAVAQAKNPRVRKFAQMMIDHHGKAKQDQAKLVTKLSIQPEETTKVRDLRTSSSDTERTLKAAPSDMFDKVYIDIQVADHQMVLDTLDRELIPNAQNPELKKSLQDFRPKVEQHLNQALEIQKMLSSPASKSGTSGSKTGSGTSGNPGSGSDSGTAPGQGSGTSSPSGSGTGAPK